MIAWMPPSVAYSVDSDAVRTSSRRAANATTPNASPARLLSGGNPQIAKADGAAAVCAYINAMPAWKRGVGRQLDGLVARALGRRRTLRRAVRWNTPFYGIDGRGWFLCFHCFTKYVKVAFLNGSSLTPLPPIASKLPDPRYLHIYEGEAIDEAQFMRWVKQAAARPGERLF